MKGLLESLLSKRYGAPRVIPSATLVQYCWNEGVEPFRCTLYKTDTSNSDVELRSAELTSLYGDSVGGSLLLGSLKVATLLSQEVYGLYRIEELNNQPAVRLALQSDPEIRFFMDAANVWYYGLKNGRLCVYDSETEELDFLGPVDAELERVLIEWEDAGRTLGGKTNGTEDETGT